MFLGQTAGVYPYALVLICWSRRLAVVLFCSCVFLGFLEAGRNKVKRSRNGGLKDFMLIPESWFVRVLGVAFIIRL